MLNKEESMKEYLDHLDHKEECIKHKLEYRKEYYKTERGKATAQRSRITRLTREEETINTLTSAEWLNILEDYRYKCAYCGKDFGPSNMPVRDHVIPISRGGNNTKENVVPALQ